SEKRFAGWLLNAGLLAVPVVSVGVWHRAHPVAVELVNNARPFAIDAVSGAGVGGGRKGMKCEKLRTSLENLWGCVKPKLVWSSGVGLMTHPGVSSRSV